MFELEYLIAFGVGAGLVALTPVAASVQAEKWRHQNHFWCWTRIDEAKFESGLDYRLQIFWSFLRREVWLE